MLSDEANVLCEKGGKSTINPDHILESLKSLGFGAWEAQVAKSFEEYKKAEKARPRMGKNPMASSGLSHEELVKLQQQLLAGGGPAAPPEPAQAKGGTAKGKEGGGGGEGRDTPQGEGGQGGGRGEAGGAQGGGGGGKRKEEEGGGGDARGTTPGKRARGS